MKTVCPMRIECFTEKTFSIRVASRYGSWLTADVCELTRFAFNFAHNSFSLPVVRAVFRFLENVSKSSHGFECCFYVNFKARANKRNMLCKHVAFLCIPCWAMLHDVGIRCVQFETSQHMPTFLLFSGDR